MLNNQEEQKTEVQEAYFAGGCFWCITPAFAEADGVLSVTAGYCGGDEVNPSYEDVKHQKTHHRETIRIAYDAGRISYRQLLRLYLDNVDPFDAEGQFIDRGYSYTLAVYFQSDDELTSARDLLAELEKETGRKPCVSVERFKAFYDAEEYHQNYYLKNPEAFERELIESGRKQL